MKNVYNLRIQPREYKRFSCSNQLNIKFQLLIESKILKKSHFTVKHSGVVFILLINVKIPTIVGILPVMSRKKCMLS